MNKFALSFKSPAEILKYIKENDIQFVDLNFTNLCGKWQHVTVHAPAFTKSTIEHGVGFSAGAVRGWTHNHETDMLLKPDISRGAMDPFSAQKSIKVFCDVLRASSKDRYERDPRAVVKAAEKYLQSTGIGDTLYCGSEPEFYVFDDVRNEIRSHTAVSYTHLTLPTIYSV